MTTIDVKKLIEENRDAPADVLIRAIFENCCNVRDDEEPDTIIETAEEAIGLWYGVDDLRLVFDFGNDAEHRRRRSDAWVWLVHQDHWTRPSVEDLSDYTCNLDEHEWFRNAIDDDQFPQRMRMG